jgi:hypothetical protein
VEARQETVPRFVIREGYALCRGPSRDNTAHRHAAFQVAIAGQGEVTMADACGTRHRAVALVVPPMVRPRMLAMPHLLTFFVEPHCAFADRLRERCDHAITAAPIPSRYPGCGRVAPGLSLRLRVGELDLA